MYCCTSQYWLCYQTLFSTTTKRNEKKWSGNVSHCALKRNCGVQHLECVTFTDPFVNTMKFIQVSKIQTSTTYHIYICIYIYIYIYVCIQGHSKVFTIGQARVNPEHYVIKCVGDSGVSRSFYKPGHLVGPRAHHF